MKNKIPVLIYHSISDEGWRYSVPPQTFEKQIKWLAKKYVPVSLSDVHKWLQHGKELPAKALAISFDDGYKSLYKNAYPVLKKYGWTAAVFTITGVPNREELMNNLPLLSNTEIHKLIKAGWEFYSHTHTHPKLTRIAKKEVSHELALSKQQIVNLRQKLPSVMAYPKGAYNKKVIDIAKKFYTAAWTIKPGFVRRGDDPYQLKRIEVNSNTSMIAFKLHLSPLIEWFQKINL